MSSGDARMDRRGFLGMPSTPVGRLSAWLLLASVVGVVLNTAVVMPLTESRAGLGGIQVAFNIALAVCVLASGLTGLWAIVRRQERSWLAFLAVVLVVAVLLFNIPWSS